MRGTCVVSLLLTFAGAAGCAGPWTVVRSSSPPALRGASRISVSIDTSELVVDGMEREELESRLSAAELSELDAALRSSVANFTSEINSEISVPISIVRSPPSEGELRMTMRVVRWQRGARGTIGPATSMDMRVEVTRGVEVVDVIELSQSASANRTRPNIPDRMRLCAVGLATVAARYFETEQTR